jgi:titin
VDLAWVDNSTDETGFALQRSVDGGVSWANIATAGPNISAYRDAGASPGTGYLYRVRSFDATRVSAWSNVASATTPQPPSAVPVAPGALTALPLSRNSLRLRWSDNSTNESGFRAFRSSDGGATWASAGTTGANATGVDVGGLSKNKTYWFKVRAYNASGESADSNVVSARLSASASASGETATVFSAIPIQAAVRAGLASAGPAAQQGWVDLLTPREDALA